MDLEENVSWDRPKTHRVARICDMRKGSEDMEKIREGFEAGNEGIVILTQVWWLTYLLTIREMRQNNEIALSSVIFVLNASKVLQSLFLNGIKAVGVWYQVEIYTNERPDSSCVLCCGWGHIKTMCCSKPKSCA